MTGYTLAARKMTDQQLSAAISEARDRVHLLEFRESERAEIDREDAADQLEALAVEYDRRDSLA